MPPATALPPPPGMMLRPQQPSSGAPPAMQQQLPGPPPLAPPGVLHQQNGGALLALWSCLPYETTSWMLHKLNIHGDGRSGGSQRPWVLARVDGIGVNRGIGKKLLVYINPYRPLTCPCRTPAAGATAASAAGTAGPHVGQRAGAR